MTAFLSSFIWKFSKDDFPHDDAGNLYFINSSRVDNPKNQSIYKSCCRGKYSKRLVRGNWVFCIKIRFTEFIIGSFI